MKLKENTYYKMTGASGDEVIGYYYNNPDALMNPNEPVVEGKDYSALGFGFNAADGGGFLPIFAMAAESLATAVELKNEIYSDCVNSKNEN